MANFNFNGLMSPILPNIYISKVSLDGAHTPMNKISANKQSAIELHIEPSTAMSADGTPLGWHGNPKENNYIDQASLSVTYDLLLETEEIYDDLDDLVGDLFKYLKIHVITFKGGSGKEAYKHLTTSPNNEKFKSDMSISSLIHGAHASAGLEGDNPWPSLPGGTAMVSGLDYKYDSKTLDNIIESSFTPNSGQQDPNSNLSLKAKREAIKEKYRHTMPDGRTLYKIPVQIKQELVGDIFPNDLAAIAVCSLDIKALFANVSYNTGDIYDFDATWIDNHGRVATEVIVKGGEIPTQGMMFFVSSEQITDDLGNSQFDDIMGTLWLGGVHKHNDKFMAGNKHDPDVAHPYLDYVLVENRRVHDFRMTSQIKKQILNFDFEKNMIFGTNYINNQLFNNPSADFSNLACFGDLLYSLNTSRQTKLSFCIDWGNLIKKHCLIPSILDKYSNSVDGNALTSFLNNNGVPNIKSFKIFRERVDSKNDVINDTGRKLVYDGYPNIYYTGQIKGSKLDQDKQIVSYNPEIKSALVPVNLHYGAGSPGFNGHMEHYTFTDYDIGAVGQGVYEYSLEVEITDPTFSLLVNVYSSMLPAIAALKPLVTFVNGNLNPLHGSTAGSALFDPITGQFTNVAKEIFNDKGWQEFSSGQSTVKGAFLSLAIIAHLFGHKSTIVPKDLLSLLDLNTATPDSINAANDILVSATDKIKSIIDSFSFTNIPKIESFSEGGIMEKSFLKSPVIATIPKKKIKVQHFFSKKEEHVVTDNIDAGYDFLGEKTGDLKNVTTAGIGLKSILLSDFVDRTLSEFLNYFPDVDNRMFSLPISLPENSSMDADIDAAAHMGSYLKVPLGATYLPKYIVDHSSNNENDYWMVTNNVLRYKMGLHGDSSSKNKLGYGPNDKIEGSLSIDAQMERIIKEYQTLAYKGIYFPQTSIVTAGSATDETVSESKEEGDKESPNSNVNWEKSNINPLPGSALLEKQKNTMTSDALLKLQKLPWAQNYGQEKLLLSLINATFIAPTVLDLKLGSFDTTLHKSRLYNYLSDIWYHIMSNPKLKGANYFQKQEIAMTEIKAVLERMPHHILALLANLHSSTRGVLEKNNKGNFRYYKDGGTSQVYELAVPHHSFGGDGPGGYMLIPKSYRNQDLKMDKFGQFWFDHMNLVEVEYLAGYGKTAKVTESKPDYFLDDVDFSSADTIKYEDVFDGTVKDPIWVPLNLKEVATMFQNLSADGRQYHIMCRLVKKKFDFFNTKAYEVLDLPAYDEYFFITHEPQVLDFHYNAYVKGFPDENIPASLPGFQIVKYNFSEKSMTPVFEDEETKEIELGMVDVEYDL